MAHASYGRVGLAFVLLEVDAGAACGFPGEGAYLYLAIVSTIPHGMTVRTSRRE